MTARLTSIFWALGVLASCATSDPNAPRQEVQTTWPDGDPRVVLGFRGDTVFERLEYHETGQLKSRGQLLNGTRHGIWNSYYDTGMPWSQVNLRPRRRTRHLPHLPPQRRARHRGRL